jgi:2-polyprenyl-3-methyl-5-hydroxy-6-metoxy-1,4-benzoquinol methylase
MLEQNINVDSLKKLQWQIMQNVAAGAIIPLMRIGDELGLFKKLANGGPYTAKELSSATSIDQRYCQEWLHAMCAAGFCSHNTDLTSFHLNPEQKAVFAHEDSPALMIGAYDVLSGNIHNIEKVKQAFKTGEGVPYEESHPCIFQGTARFFRPSYSSNLIQKWLPKLSRATEILENGGRFADIGCGFGLSTLMIAEAFPDAKVFGFDLHEPSIKSAKKYAIDANLDNKITYGVSDAKSYSGEFDLLAFFDCLHDMGDPLGAAKYAYQHLSKDGFIILIEPTASDKPSENLNTIGQMYYSFSTMGCVPTSKSQEVGLALGAQAGPKKLMDILLEAGFKNTKVVYKNATNMVIEAQK